MISREIIEKIIIAGTFAPSGENCQPWKFEVKGDTVYAFNKPEADYSLYSWGQRASFIAHGALLENILIAGKNFGFKGNVEYFPTPENHDLTFKVEFYPDSVEKDTFFDFITKRKSNRKPYKKISLTEDEKEFLENLNKDFSEVNFVLETETKKIKILGEVGGINEKILFSNKKLHNFFFNHISWTDVENKQKSIGFYIKTLELPLIARLLFPIMSKWDNMNFMNKFGFSTLIGKGNGQLYSSSPAIGIIKIKNLDPKSFLKAGQLLQRVWLAATSRNLHMQPLTGVLFLKLKILSNNTNGLTQTEIDLINNSYEKIEKAFNIQSSEFICMMFRIGHAEPPTAESTRLKPEIIFK